MVKDAHRKAVSYMLSKCDNLPIISVLTYGSYARGNYKPNSDIDLLVVVDSRRYHAKDLETLIKVCETCDEKFHVVLQMDIILDSEIELWNKGILLDSHSFSDPSFYKRDGKVLFGTDISNEFKLPPDYEKKARLNLGIIEAEFKRWFCHYYHQTGKSLVPHWMTGWLLTTYLNALGIVEIASFDETRNYVGRIPDIAGTPSFKKYKTKKELTADDFIDLFRIIRRLTAEEAHKKH